MTSEPLHPLTDEHPMLIAIMGPTASGKSAVAEAIADRLGLQLVSADAFMVYRGFDIGTNKPKRKDYELIDIIDPHEEFGVGEWVRLATTELDHLWNEKKGALIVGGTGFYIRALFEEYAEMRSAPDPALRADLEQRLDRDGLAALVEQLWSLDPDAAQATDLKNPVRVRRALERALDPSPPIDFQLPPFIKHKFVLQADPAELDQAIQTRVDAMFQAGWKQEVQCLLEKGTQTAAPAFRAIGYECLVDLISGRLGEEEAKAKIATATRQYAKRQRTWLRSEPNARAVNVSPLGGLGANRATEAILDVLMSPGT